MTETKPDNGVGLAKSMLVRSATWRPRIVLSLVLAVAFGPIAGWATSGVWLVAYLALQALEVGYFAPQRTRVYGLKET